MNIYKEPERWADLNSKIFPSQVGFISPLDEMLMLPTTQQGQLLSTLKENKS